MFREIISLVLVLSVTCLSAQNKPITHKDYDLWKNITDVKISDEGTLIVSVIETNTKRGDGFIHIHNTLTNQKFIFSNGYDSSITADENYVIFKRKPKYEVIRKEKKKKIKQKDLSKDALFIYDVKDNKILDSVLRVKKYKVPKENEGWVIIEKFKKRKDTSKVKKRDTIKKEVPLSAKQNYALVYDLKSKKKDTIYQIKEFVLPKKGEKFFYTLKGEKKKDRDIGVYQYDLKQGTKTVIDSGKYVYDKLASDRSGNQFSYIATIDSTSQDSLKYELYYYKDNQINRLVDISGKNLRKNWVLSKDQSPFFSESGKRLYFYGKPIVQLEKDTTLLDEEIPEVDIWNWQDKLIQPEQKSKFDKLSKKAFISYFDTEKNTFTHLQDDKIDDLIFDKKKEQPFILGASSSPYDVQRSWDFPWKRDFYIINTSTGQKRLGLENTALRPFLGPDGAFALYFDIHQQHWFSLDLKTNQKKNLTADVPVVFYNEDNDHPYVPRPYGFGGFDKNGNALIYDKFDIWSVALTGNSKPKNITANGRKRKIEYRTEKLDRDNRNNATYIDDELLITSFDKTTKASGLYGFRKGKLKEKVAPSDFYIDKYQKAKNKDVFTFRKQNFNTYQDLHVTINGFKNSKQITDINPHKKDYKWGTAELFSWKTYDGKELEGIIYKPENFDPSKKYPLITYFYEKRSDTYRRYYIPRPSRSIVNPSYLVSNDYIMFVPDIVYKEGKPGSSAYNCIVSGVEALEKLGYIDSKNMGIQGQSWGGYQVAYLITKTNKFKAAMAGAPVSNMTSAYGGIRWESGLSRAFQYEKTQSRIGKNLWDGFDLYIENSPLFGIPKIETPLLMMHNDKDGAVPYYQGIEMFMGMRRLQKPVWLLVYNDEAHNLKKTKNKQDLSIRMMQFFDYYLKGKPAPIWMTKGVPRIHKGKDFGYELEINKQKGNTSSSSN